MNKHIEDVLGLDDSLRRRVEPSKLEAGWNHFMTGVRKKLDDREQSDFDLTVRELGLSHCVYMPTHEMFADICRTVSALASGEKRTKALLALFGRQDGISYHFIIPRNDLLSTIG